MEKKGKFVHFLKVLAVILVPTLIVNLLFYTNFPRLWVSIKTFIAHIGYFFAYDFLKSKTPPRSTLSLLLDQGYFDLVLPLDVEVFKERIGVAFSLLINFDTLSLYWSDVSSFLYYAGRVITFIAIVGVVILIISRMSTYDPNSLPKDSKGLVKFKKFEKKMLCFFSKIKSQWDEVNCFFVRFTLISLFLYATHLLPVVLDTASELLLLFSGGHFDRFFLYVVVATTDISLFFVKTPLIISVSILLFVIHALRKKFAVHELEYYEACNADFYDSTGNTILFLGASGSGKTSLLTDAVLTTEMTLRIDKLLGTIHQMQSYFPNFPWRQLEELIKKFSKLEKGNEYRIYNRKSVRSFVSSLFNSPHPLGYDGPTERWTGIKVETLQNAVETYAIAFFYYAQKNPLSFTALPISHSYYDAQQYFPVYGCNFFTETEEEFKEARKMSYILDFDDLRLGKKMGDDKDPFLLDIGIVAVPEVGKERGSSFDVRTSNEDSAECNVANDYYPEFQTVRRHMTELNYIPLSKTIYDDQDLMSLNSKERQLIESTITIDRMHSQKGKNALPLFFLDELFCSLITNTFHRAYDERKSKKRDDTILWYLLRNFASAVDRYYLRLKMTYGYDKIAVFNTNSSLDDVSNTSTQMCLYLSYKKVFSNRFNDVYLSQLFDAIQAKSTKSIMDHEQFSSLKPVVSEFNAQHSNMFNNYFNVLALGKKKKNKEVK